MFGFVIPDAEAVSAEEIDRYRAVYCGLCRTLSRRYGQAARLCLTYDLTFYVLLCQSLHEPPENEGAGPCPVHPLQRRPWTTSPWSDRAADLSVALAFHKVLDDIRDDGSAAAKAAHLVLRGSYEKARERIPGQCSAIEEAMADIRAIERREKDASEGLNPDAAARRFGAMLGRIFGSDQGFWAESMEETGEALGRLIYLMDAAVDFAEDKACGTYNPFVATGASPATMRTVLEMAAADTARAFEKLPLEQDVHLMRSILYAGLWAQFNRTYQ